MKLTKSQGIACLKAMEKIERGEWDGENIVFFELAVREGFDALGWGKRGVCYPNFFYYDRHRGYDQSQVATALAMCVTLSGLELRYE